MDKQAEAWQQRLDGDFPQGVVAVFYDPDNDPGEDSDDTPTVVRFRAPRIEVLGMTTAFSPQIQLVDFYGMISRDVTASIDTYSVQETEPALVLVTFTDGRTMRWNANVPEKLAQLMKEGRF